MVLRLDSVLRRLGSVEWGRFGLEWVVLFGGLARRGLGRDVDLLVLPGGEAPLGLDRLLDLVVSVADRVGVDPDRVDIVDATRASCTVILDAWRHGKLVYEAERGSARRWLLRRVLICYDYRLIARKHGLERRAIRSIIRRWST